MGDGIDSGVKGQIEGQQLRPVLPQQSQLLRHKRQLSRSRIMDIILHMSPRFLLQNISQSARRTVAHQVPAPRVPAL
jgi:hypothetical protein